MMQIRKHKISVKKAVALSYKPTKPEDSPLVNAKGKGSIAEAIIAQAKEYNVPIVQNTELADMLLFIKIGNEIPTETFIAVAEILRYVYALKGETPPLPSGNQRQHRVK